MEIKDGCICCPWCGARLWIGLTDGPVPDLVSVPSHPDPVFRSRCCTVVGMWLHEAEALGRIRAEDPRLLERAHP